MSTTREAETVIDAALEDCLAVILDMDGYPGWVAGYRSAVVEERDERGRPAITAYTAGGFGMTASYRLAYTYSDDPVTISFSQVEGDLTRSITGRYELTPDGEATRVMYTASIELAMPMPGLVRRRAEGIVMDSALKALAGEVRRRNGDNRP